MVYNHEASTSCFSLFYSTYAEVPVALLVSGSLIFAMCDIMVYDKKYIFGFHPQPKRGLRPSGLVNCGGAGRWPARARPLCALSPCPDIGVLPIGLLPSCVLS